MRSVLVCICDESVDECCRGFERLRGGQDGRIGLAEMRFGVAAWRCCREGGGGTGCTRASRSASCRCFAAWSWRSLMQPAKHMRAFVRRLVRRATRWHRPTALSPRRPQRTADRGHTRRRAVRSGGLVRDRPRGPADAGAGRSRIIRIENEKRAVQGGASYALLLCAALEPKQSQNRTGATLDAGQSIP